MRFQIALAAFLIAAPTALPASAFEISDVFGGLFQSDKDEKLASGVRKLTWDDLAPGMSPEAQAAAAELNMRIDTMSDDEVQQALDIINAGGSQVVPELDGEVVLMEGYLVPLDFEATEVTAFVLVPYVGACIHVPPPPPNQIVFIEYKDGIEMKILDQNPWTPFRVKGKLRAASATTALAEVGYQMSATSVDVMSF